MEKLPKIMRSLVAPKKCTPAGYVMQQRPVPNITKPRHVLIKVHAAGINTGELQAMAGHLSMFWKPDYPAPIGLEGSGVVVAVGTDVQNFKPGDEVYGFSVDKPMFRDEPAGFASEYVVLEERFLIPKPASLPFEDAASMHGFVVTALQTIRRGLEIRGERSLEGKTVFVPAGLSGTGAIIAQVAKHIYGAKKLITTVSTPKIPLVEEYLPGLYDQVIDYNTTKPEDVVPPGSVDFVVSTQWGTLKDGIPLLNPKTGTLMSIASIPSKAVAREIIGADRFGWWLGAVLDVAQLYYKWLLWGTNIKHEFLSGGPHIPEDRDWAADVIAKGKVKAFIRVVEFDDIDAVRANCEQVFTGKGGIGKLVVKIA